MKISHRYPVNTEQTDIDRAWLVKQLPRAKRPNALLEVAFSPLSIVRIAAQTWVSVDTLVDFLLGDDDLTHLELANLSKTMDIFCAGDSSDYLARQTLDICTERDEIEDALHQLPNGFPLIRDMLLCGSVPQAALYAAAICADLASDHSINLGPYDKPRRKRITRRRRKAA